MKAEEKFFVVKGIRENFHWYEREEGYWIRSKHNHGFSYEEFYKDKTEADRECEKLRESYRKAIESLKEGDEVWFIYCGKITVSKVINITNFGYEMYYQMTGCDDRVLSNRLFKSKEDLLNYLCNNIEYLK